MNELETIRYKGIYIKGSLLYIVDKIEAIRKNVDVAELTIEMVKAELPNESYDLCYKLLLPFRPIAVCELFGEKIIPDVNSIIKQLNSEYANDKELTGLITELISVK